MAYRVRFIKSGEDTEIKKFLSTNAETFTEGSLVTLSSGTITLSVAATDTVLGICRQAGVGVTGTEFAVEVPLHRFAEIEIYTDGAVTAGVPYGLNDDGTSIKSSEAAAHLRIRPLQTATTAGYIKAKLVDSTLL
jgi:hypothetical protein